MKRFNKFLALFLAVVMTVGLLPAAVSATTEDSNIILEENFDSMTALSGSASNHGTFFFEAYWSGGSASIQNDNGNKYVELETSPATGSDGTSKGNCAGFVDVCVSKEAFEVGGTYKISAWFKTSAATDKQEGNLLVQNSLDGRAQSTGGDISSPEVTAANNLYQRDFLFHLDAGVWTLKTMTFTINAFSEEANCLKFRVGSTCDLGANQTVWVDDIRLEKVEDSDVVFAENFDSWVSTHFTPVEEIEYSTDKDQKWNGASPASGWAMGSFYAGDVSVQPVVAEDGNVSMKLTPKYDGTNQSRVKLRYIVPEAAYNAMVDGAEYILKVSYKYDGTNLTDVNHASYEVHQNGLGTLPDGTSSHLSKDLKLTGNDWTDVSYTFTLNKAQMKYDTLHIYVGLPYVAADKNYSGALYIDNVSLVKKNYYETMVSTLATEDTYALEGNADGTGKDLILKAGKTLDLNGYTLTVDSLSALKGAKVIDTSVDGTGKVVVEEGNLVLQADNGYLPIKVDGGYVFCNVGLVQNEQDETVTDALKYDTKPSFGNYATYLADGAEDNGLSILVRLTWTNGAGTTTTMDIPCAEDHIKDVYGGTATNFEMTVSGVENVTDLKVSTVVCSDLGVVLESTPVAYAAPAAE